MGMEMAFLLEMPMARTQMHCLHNTAIELGTASIQHSILHWSVWCDERAAGATDCAEWRKMVTIELRWGGSQLPPGGWMLSNRHSRHCGTSVMLVHVRLPPSPNHFPLNTEMCWYWNAIVYSAALASTRRGVVRGARDGIDDANEFVSMAFSSNCLH